MTHTDVRRPAFLATLLARPDNERPFVMFPIGYPMPAPLVPDLARKPLDEVMVLLE